MGLADIKLVLTPGGGSKVVVNGTDLTTVVNNVRIEASAKGDRIPQLVLQLHSDIELEGEGIVHLEPPSTDIDPDELLGAFLASIDPEELEARALAGMEGLGEPETTGQSFLRALKELADVDGS